MIKIFDKLRDAYPYCKKCPMCGADMNLSIVERNHTNSYDSSYSLESFNYGNKAPNRICVDSGGNNKIVFDINSEKIVELTIMQSNDYQRIFELGSSNPVQIIKSPTSVNYDIRGGKLMQGHRIDCIQCMQYSYTLQLRFDMEEQSVENVILNSEFISIEEGEDLYEIRNVYTMNKTEYSHITRKNRYDTLQLPLVSENLFNPKEVLNRIKNLLIFS